MGTNKPPFATDENIADKTYQPSDYQSSSQLAQGLATTHEQVSDCYVEGTVDGTIDNVDGKDKKMSKPE